MCWQDGLWGKFEVVRVNWAGYEYVNHICLCLNESWKRAEQSRVFVEIIIYDVNKRCWSHSVCLLVSLFILATLSGWPSFFHSSERNHFVELSHMLPGCIDSRIQVQTDIHWHFGTQFWHVWYVIGMDICETFSSPFQITQQRVVKITDSCYAISKNWYSIQLRMPCILSHIHWSECHADLTLKWLMKAYRQTKIKMLP